MINIVELSISAKKNRQAATDTQYVYYPVSVVPVKYWAVEKEELSIVAKTIVQLCQLKPLSRAQLMEKLNIPPQWSYVIEQELNNLLMKGIVHERHGMMYETVDEPEPVQHVYKSGYMFFDEVRRKFFEYVHEGELMTSYDIEPPFMLERNTMFSKEFYDSSTCDEQMKLAVANYNERKTKYFEEGVTVEEAAIKTADVTHISIEKRSFTFVKTSFYMPIQLQVGDVFYSVEGIPYQKPEVISPFIKQPSVVLQTVIEAQPKGKEAIEWLIAESESAFSQQFEEAETLLERIEERLQGVKICDAVFEYLQLSEQAVMNAEAGERSLVASRPAIINNFNLTIEATMKPLVASIQPFDVPEQWKKEHKKRQLPNYIEKLFYELRTDLPSSLKSNMKTIANKMVEYGALERVHIYGNRDYMAVLLLHDRVHRKYWFNELKEAPHYLQKLERIVSLRNDNGGHHNDYLLQLSDEAFYKLLYELHDDVYAIIRFLEGNK